MPTPKSVIEDKTLEKMLFIQKKSFAQIGKKFGLTRQAVESLAKRKFGDLCSKAKEKEEQTQRAIEIFKKNKSLEETAKEVKLSVSSLARRFNRAGFRYSKYSQWTPDKIEQLKEMREQGLTYKAIAYYFGISENAAMFAWQRYVEHEKKPAHPNQSVKLPMKERKELTEKHKAEIRELLKKGLDTKQMAEKLGISRCRVYQIWNDIKEEDREKFVTTKMWLREGK